MRRLVSRLAALLGVMTLLGIVVAAPGGAAGSATVTPNPVPVSTGQDAATVTVDWNFGSTNTAVFIDVCKKSSADPTFDYTKDCDSGVANALNGTADGKGSAPVDIPVGSTFASGFFPESIHKWGCYPNGVTPPSGFTAAAQCYIRVTQTAVSNNTDAINLPYSFESAGSSIPEVPVVVLPVLVGAVLVGGYLLINRRRALA